MRLVVIVFFAGIAVFTGALCWPDRHMRSRDIGCAKLGQTRGQEICRAISDTMEWTWMGHAIVSPGWRTTWPGIVRVYCREHISASDLPVLESLCRGLPDWRLESGARDLMRIVRNVDGNGDEPETSIFNPKNPSYLLKDGCR